MRPVLAGVAALSQFNFRLKSEIVEIFLYIQQLGNMLEINFVQFFVVHGSIV